MVTNPLRALFDYVKRLHLEVKIWLGAVGLHQTSRYATFQPDYNTLYAYELGATPTHIGLFNSLSTGLRTFIQIPAGWLCDKYGARITVLIGMVLSLAVPVIFFLATTWHIAMISVVILGIAQTVTLPYVDIILIHYAKKEERVMGIGFSRTLWAIPRLFMPTIIAFIVSTSGGISVEGIRPTFLVQICLITSALIIPIAFFKRRLLDRQAKPQADTPDSATSSPSFVDNFLEVLRSGDRIIRFILLWQLRMFTWRMVLPFMAIYAVEFKGADSFILGGWATATGLLSLVCSMPLGKLSDKYGRKKVIYFLATPSRWLRLLILLFAPNPMFLVFVGVFDGIYEAGGLAWITMMWERVSEEKRGRWFGLLNTFSVVNAAAPVLGSLLWEQGAITLLFLLPILCDLVVTFPLLRTIPENRSK